MTEAQVIEGSYLTSAELAERWRMKEATLRNMRWKGDGPPYVQPSKGGKVLYRMADIEAYEASNTHGGAND